MEFINSFPRDLHKWWELENGVTWLPVFFIIREVYLQDALLT